MPAAVPKTATEDDVLLAQAAQGNQQAIEALLIRYKDLVRRKASSMFMAGADAEDVIQEGMIGLFKAIRDYRPVHRVPFAAFASYCIMAQITDAVRQASRQKHRPLNNSLSLQSLIQTDDDNDLQLIELFIGSNGPDPEEALLNNENLTDLQTFFIEELSQLEQQVVLLFIQKLSYKQIADCLGCSSKKVDNALSRARQKFLAYRRRPVFQAGS
ncbi:MAG TPA: RNA polymerase sporulation sigma factor SigH [Clostridiales bacterium]|nr:RNA polymerase sporulation sigma factor SigH [Clostridiales bacterium]